MDTQALSRIRRMLLIGLIASVVTVIGGELPIGWTVYPVMENDPMGLMGMLAGSGELSLLQLACGALFGGVGIPLQYYGFEAAARLVAAGSEKSAKAPGCARLIHAGAAATGFLGGIVHVICVALMFVCRLPDSAGAAIDFALWLVAPISVVFMPVYYAMCIALFVAVVRGRTCLPRWAAVFNPLTGTIILNALPLVAPNTPLVNALGMANMGLGSVLTFAGLLALLPRSVSSH